MEMKRDIKGKKTNKKTQADSITQTNGSGNIETRKVQLTGGSSYVITLPKEWVTQLSIKQGSSVTIITQPDGSLLINPEKSQEKIIRIKEFLVSEEEDEPNFLLRRLIGAYIMGFTQFKIISKTKISPYVREVVTTFINTAIGPVIDEETVNSIILKDILNPTEMTFDNSIKRELILATSMHEDAMAALGTKDKTLCKDVISRDKQINQRHMLIARETNMVLSNVILANRMGVSLTDAHHFFVISKQLERIGDHARLISGHVLALIEKKKEIKTDLFETLQNTTKFSLTILKDALTAWDKKDVKLANTAINRIKDLNKMCEEITEMPSITVDNEVEVNYITESIRRTGEYAGNIAEVVMDNLIND